MPSFYLLLQRVHDIVHDSPMKMKYSDPKFYTGGVDISNWSKLSSKTKKEALLKNWYVYYSFRNPETGKLVRQTNIKAGVNTYKNKKDRLYILNKIKKGLIILLQKGYNPYQENEGLIEFFEKQLSIKEEEITDVTSSSKKEIKSDINNTLPTHTIEDAFNLGLKIKSKVQSATSFKNFNGRINRFKKWLEEQSIKPKDDICSINKKNVILYLNSVLQTSSARNRNNTRTDISSLFQTLEDNEIIKDNFVKKINILKSTPERNKTYTPTELNEIFDYLKNTNNILHLFVQFVSYNFLRPVEVCRLKVGDIDIIDKKIYVRAKNQPVKIKIIPTIIIDQLPDLKKLNQNDFLFTPNKIGDQWATTENNKRDYFTKQFKKVKDHFGLGKEYGLYSFRHTFITKLYNEMSKSYSPFEAKSKLMLITGHKRMEALELYLRKIDAILPEDYSNLLK